MDIGSRNCFCVHVLSFSYSRFPKYGELDMMNFGHRNSGDWAKQYKVSGKHRARLWAMCNILIPTGGSDISLGLEYAPVIRLLDHPGEVQLHVQRFFRLSLTRPRHCT